MEALENGYEEGVALDYSGNISEGSGENIFIIKNNEIYTTSMGASALAGITRDTVISIVRDLGYELKSETLPREFLYLADEIFLTGTAAEITPVSSVDRIPVGNGKCGEITKIIQDEFFKIASGENEKYKKWLTIVK